MAFIFSKVSQSFRQSCEDYSVSVRTWVSWGHTDRLLWQHFSLSCDLRSGLSSLHRWMHLDGLLKYLCLPDIVLSSKPTGVTPGIQSCKTLTRGFASLILGKGDDTRSPSLLSCCSHNREVPLRHFSEGHWAEAWHSWEILPGRGQNILQNHLVSFLWWNSALCFFSFPRQLLQGHV